ncbi:MAG: LacI family DNA-binding transcriptional regulator [Opitutales bacterium]
MERVTLKDIAQRAGVSVSAVSLALSGKGNISKQQQERIRKLADELGYVPNPLLASLASKRFRTGDHAKGTLIALLEFPVMEGGPSPNAYHTPLIRYAKELGYQARLMDLPEIERYRDLPQMLYRCGMQGVIATGQPPPEMFADPERWKHFAMVQCGRYRSSLPFHTVRSDIFRSIKLIFQTLRDRGYQRIGFAPGRHRVVMEDDEARLGAALAMLHFQVPKAHYIPPYEKEFADKDCFLEWARREEPEVVVTFGVGQYYDLIAAGFRIPEDLGVACLHGFSRPLSSNGVRVAGLVQQTDIIAEQSLILLDQLIRYNTRGFPEMPRHTLIPSRWIEGETVKESPKTNS